MCRQLKYVVQRGYSEEWGWHWLILDPTTIEGGGYKCVGLLIEGEKTLEIEISDRALTQGEG